MPGNDALAVAAVSDTPDGKSMGARTRRAPKLTGYARRQQLIRVAMGLFANSGLHGTTTQALAKAAGVTEPTLYIHFESKEALFQEAVEANIENRLRALERRLELFDSGVNPPQIVEKLAHETVGVCVDQGTNAIIMNWALLEVPEIALDLHRGEAGAIGLMWERAVQRGQTSLPSFSHILHPFIPQAVNVCLAYGLWLSALRHTPATAKELIGQYARAIAWMAWHGPDAVGQ